MLALVMAARNIVRGKRSLLLGGSAMTYRTQLWIMTMLYASVTAVLFYWLTLFMATSEDIEPAPIPFVDYR